MTRARVSCDTLSSILLGPLCEIRQLPGAFSALRKRKISRYRPRSNPRHPSHICFEVQQYIPGTRLDRKRYTTMAGNVMKNMSINIHTQTLFTFPDKVVQSIYQNSFRHGSCRRYDRYLLERLLQHIAQAVIHQQAAEGSH